MKGLWLVAAVFYFVAPMQSRCQAREEVDVGLEEVSTYVVSLSWTSLPPAKCGETVTYAVYRGESEDFKPSPDNQIAADLTSPNYVAHEPKLRKTWYYRVLASRTPGYCVPPELKTGTITADPLDLGRGYIVSVGDKKEVCHAISTTELRCPSLPSFHGVIASQPEHEFLIGCLSSDFEDGNWSCVTLTPGTYRISVHSQTVTVWEADFKRIDTKSGKALDDITPVFSILAVLK